MKKNMKYLITSIVVICLISIGVLGLTGCGDSGVTADTTVKKEEENVSAPLEEEEEIATDESAVANTEEIAQESDRVFVGDTFTVYYNPDDGSSTPALNVTVTDVGTGIDNTYNTKFVYVELDIENIFDQELFPIDCLEGFYGDDYILDYAITYNMEDSLDSVSIAPGRKAKGRYYASCPNYDQLNVIEMDFAERSIVIKDTSLANSTEMSISENTITDKIVYGTYVYHDTEHGIINTAEISFTTAEDGGEYIYIDSRGEGGHGVIEFFGYFKGQEKNEDNSYTAIQHAEDSDYGYNAEVKITFVEGGLNVEVVSSEFDTLYDVTGYYELESELNLDEVG